MNEILIFILFITILLLPKQLLHFIKEPVLKYVKWGLGIALLAMVWFLENSGKLAMKVLISAIVLYSFIKYEKDRKKVKEEAINR